ncbi:MAG TPA: hypothetical protein VD833_17220 [Vicinamibacterales bacterium]|nr:hypothetical protein [Vicinamibacterales bacterium]
MRHLRRILPRLAFAWLLCEAATLALAPTVSWLGSVEELFACNCTHGDHAMCPMHHKPAPGSRICLMQSAGDTDTAVLPTLFGGAGPLPQPATPAAPRSQGTMLLAATIAPAGLSAPPDPPPPRL